MAATNTNIGVKLDYASPGYARPLAVWNVVSGLCGVAGIIGLALVSLLGIDGLLLPGLLLAAIAVVSGLVGLLHRRSRAYRYGIVLSVIGLVFGASGAYFSTTVGRHTRCEIPPRSRCASNLTQIGNAVLLYANDHNGHMPPGIAGLLEEDLTTAVLICPASNDTPAFNPTTQPTEADVLAGGHLSYIYLGAGFTYPASASAVIAYEPLSNHQGAGMNVLFGDLHVEYFQTATANKILAELNAGHNPPRPETFK
jgi:prepilin-type processing-associated H-X9-DG protein